MVYTGVSNYLTVMPWTPPPGILEDDLQYLLGKAQTQLVRWLNSVYSPA
jgi:hypothetical protein